MKKADRDNLYEIALLAGQMSQALTGMAFIIQTLEEETPIDDDNAGCICLARRMPYFTGCLWSIYRDLETLKAGIDVQTGEADGCCKAQVDREGPRQGAGIAS